MINLISLSVALLSANIGLAAAPPPSPLESFFSPAETKPRNAVKRPGALTDPDLDGYHKLYMSETKDGECTVEEGWGHAELFECQSFKDGVNIETIAAYGFTPKDGKSWGDDVTMFSIHTYKDADCNNKTSVLFSSFVSADGEPYPFFPCQTMGKVKSLMSIPIVKNDLCDKSFKPEL
ncbi:hypothetical protein CERZMDRAFT_91359 [Cercospora zeae-maydis SCOH1-5]|uniref:AA1-like domain-containing protein n=1 Tax=Cercospora zeae-maydis SCOH1-5 TaxID=717836 RepID=A0A6A6F710_9PEZI|nr:hypothetical protein CERZMDRAFT_91359 [Cercospora zeae-maydis SCOH1-5]